MVFNPVDWHIGPFVFIESTQHSTCICKDAAMACLQVTIQALVTWEALAPMRIKWLYAHMQMSSFGYLTHRLRATARHQDYPEDATAKAGECFTTD